MDKRCSINAFGNMKVGIIGAAGFTGIEILKILRHHHDVEVIYITSYEHQNKALNSAFAQIECEKYNDLVFSNHPVTIEDIPKLDIAFLAVPDEAAMKWAPALLEKSIKVIDISGSFRLKDVGKFEEYYKVKHTANEVIQKATYGLTEVNREEIKTATLLANPGCYATSAILPLYCIREHLSKYSEDIILDAKSGTSGAGTRKEKDSLAYSKVNDNFRVYKVKAHQHIPEIEQAIGVYHKDLRIKMTPQLLPLFRGILSMIYLKAEPGVSVKELTKSFEKISIQEPFIRYIKNPEEIELSKVQNTNFIDVSFHHDDHTGVLTIFSALDNLQKGAAGSAIQNMNLMSGYPETLGLTT